MQNLTTPDLPSDPPVVNSEEGVSLLVEVDFKWLMAGEGWWIDTTRLHCDPAYVANLVQLAQASDSPALQSCAALLLRQSPCAATLPTH
ncbi:MAG: hypothetical protein WCG50_00270 [Rhodoferax sp.]|uniref:hypothetical protein n=1 Tax=Rhodoferax sp. TaxID=50421 RepID=UPI003019FEF0